MQIFLEDRTTLDLQNIINLTKLLDAFVDKITNVEHMRFFRFLRFWSTLTGRRTLNNDQIDLKFGMVVV